MKVQFNKDFMTYLYLVRLPPSVAWSRRSRNDLAHPWNMRLASAVLLTEVDNCM